MRGKILVIGFQPYNEKMYPHIYDVIEELKSDFELLYVDEDDRGSKLISIEERLRKFRNLLSHPSYTIDLANNIVSTIRQSFAIRTKLLNIAINQKIQIIIAIDHTAFNLAVRCFPSSIIVYWSHDYIAPDSSNYNYFYSSYVLKKNRTNFHKCKLILIQDVYRSSVLDTIISSYGIKRHYLPVSLRDNRFARLTASRKKSKNILEGKTKILQITASKSRFSIELLKQYQKHSDSINLHFQGTVTSDVLNAIEHSKHKPTIIPYSNTFSKMRENIAQADIGFIGYANHDLNHAFISHASGQLVEFLRIGIPVITRGSEELTSFVRKNKIGVTIQSLDKIMEAVKIIAKNYSHYSIAARKTFEDKFQLSNYTALLKDELIKLTQLYKTKHIE